MAVSLAARERQFVWSAGAVAFMNRHHFTLMLYQLSRRNRLVPMLHLHNDGGLTRDILGGKKRLSELWRWSLRCPGFKSRVWVKIQKVWILSFP